MMMRKLDALAAQLAEAEAVNAKAAEAAPNSSAQTLLSLLLGTLCGALGMAFFAAPRGATSAAPRSGAAGAAPHSPAAEQKLAEVAQGVEQLLAAQRSSRRART